jgi:hypothetical protein
MKWKKAKCYPLESIGYMYVDDQVRWQEQKDFVGYDQKSKWYKLYIPNERNIVINRIVEFNNKKKHWIER